MASKPNDIMDPGRGESTPSTGSPTGPAETRPPPYKDAGVLADLEARTEERGILWRIVDSMILCGVAGMMITVSLQVIMRLAAQSFPWTEELTRYLFIWTAFLGLAVGFRAVEHARITFLISLFPHTIKRVMVHLYVLAGVVFFTVVAYQGLMMAVRQFRSGEISPALGCGMYLVTLPVALGAVLAIAAHFQSVYKDKVTRQRLEMEEGEMTR